MKKFITIAGAILVGTTAATQLTLEEKVVDGLLHGLEAAEHDVQLIKNQLQSIGHRKRSSSVDSTPKVEGFFLSGLGELTGIAGDLTGMGLGIYQTIEQPQVEGFLSGLGELTGIAGDLTGIGLGIYNTVHPNVQAQYMNDYDEEDIEVETPLFRGLRSHFSSLRRPSSFRRQSTPTFRRPPTSTSHPLSSGKKSSSSLHPMEIANMASQIISGLGQAGAGIYSQIEQGRAAAAQAKYYEEQQQQQQQPQVQQYFDGPVYVRPTRVVYNVPAGGVIYPYDE
ncbi:UNKNOWN [Stylonychia lemnae]|uniref:Uncharacterized protein n=1 Tax=Stylonychia lemnae TaxID=5949 RepID=A0A077ZRT3_STYLE|nr:UNKNOWN [Stylonychia lemnae]|eukprot:CDW72184.1 UNKNOWN [Stylonychia lemnae]